MEASSTILESEERFAFVAYVEAISRRCYPGTTAREARLFCAAEYEAWSDAFFLAYGERP